MAGRLASTGWVQGIDKPGEQAATVAAARMRAAAKPAALIVFTLRMLD